MNKVILVGRITHDLEIRTTPSNIDVCKFNIAASDGKNTEFLNCVAWRKDATNLSKYCHKGSQVAIEGHLTNRSFTAQDGTKKYNTEVVCEKISYLNSSNKDNGNTANENTDAFEDFAAENIIQGEDLPFE